MNHDGLARPPGNGRLRFVVMLDSLAVTSWEADCLSQLLQCADPVAVVIPNAVKPMLGGRDLKAIANSLLYLACKWLFWRPPAQTIHPFPKVLHGLPVIRCDVERRGRFSEHIRPKDIARITAHTPDFVMKFGFGILRGAMLTAVPLGVWSFHHGDERRFRGRPAGFWEIFHRASTTGVVLQRLTDSLDGGIILYRGQFATRRDSYRANLEQILRGAACFPAAVARGVLAGRPFPTEASSTKAPIYYTPTNRETIVMLGRLAAAKSRRLFYGLFELKVWAVGLAQTDIGALTSGQTPSPLRWLRPPGALSFWADPFIIEQGGRLLLAAEELDYRDPTGRIVLGPLPADAGAFEPKQALWLPHHASYPCLVESNGHIYCVPETTEANKLVLYRLDPATCRFEPQQTLIENVRAVDPTLFQSREGTWWIAYTDEALGAMTHLMLFHAKTVNGPYVPHSLNPVKVDCTSARGAGRPFFLDSRLVRPAQDCSDGYGGGITFNEVVSLTPSEFTERSLGTLRPFDPAYADGLHHICEAGGMTVVDGCHHRLHPLAFFYRLLIAIRAHRAVNG